MLRSRLRSVLLVLLALGLFGCDEATKSVARERLAEGSVEIVRGAVELRYVQNDDIAFSAFRQLGVAHSPAFLAVLALVGIIGAVGLAIASTRWCARVGLALVIGGALGNFADRVARGYVVDFIHVHGWPVFNVADIAVVVGVGVLLLSRMRKEKEAPPSTVA
ncbi:MAG: signal peptidase II [Labilithrix sp.]|nr:signal peptidase II [Labilithrix sp.]MCW5812710.1 signal peptidase II [Labilithrix sp.]